jgi:hypothetical protein
MRRSGTELDSQTIRNMPFVRYIACDLCVSCVIDSMLGITIAQRGTIPCLESKIQSSLIYPLVLVN